MKREDRHLRPVALQDGDSVFVALHAQRQGEFCINEGQRLAPMGSWAFNASGFFAYWSAELFHICGLDSANGAPTLQNTWASRARKTAGGRFRF
jgi:hypothetical protein